LGDGGGDRKVGDLAVRVVTEGSARVLQIGGVGGVGGREGVAGRHRFLHVELAVLAPRHRLLVLDLGLAATHREKEGSVELFRFGISRDVEGIDPRDGLGYRIVYSTGESVITH
jgi:hypothetical protein